MARTLLLGVFTGERLPSFLRQHMRRKTYTHSYANDNAPQRVWQRVKREASSPARINASAVKVSSVNVPIETYFDTTPRPKQQSYSMPKRPEVITKGIFSIVAFIGTTLALAWLAFVTIVTPMPFEALSSLVFIIGAAIHRMGKAYSDYRVFGSTWHVVTGWLIAVLGAAMMQQTWLSVDVEPILKASTMPETWVYGTAGAAIIILLSSIFRFAKRKISTLGLLAVSLVTIILPVIAARPDLLTQFFASVPGVDPVPGFALIIGAAIMASAIGMIVVGLQRNKFMFIVVGVCVFGLEALMMSQPAFMSLEFAIVTFLSLIIGLAIGGWVAGSNLGSNVAQ